MSLRDLPAASGRTLLFAILMPFVLLLADRKAVNAQSADAEERCKGDVMRLCSEFVPDTDSIVACLKKKRLQLTSSCFNALSPPSQQKELSTSKKPSKRRRTISPAEAARSTRVHH